MSAWISSAEARHAVARSQSSRISASRAPRSSATQHMSLEEVKCRGSPRTSQIPRSGLRQFASAASTWWTSSGQTLSGIWSRDFVCR